VVADLAYSMANPTSPEAVACPGADLVAYDGGLWVEAVAFARLH